LIDSKGKDPQRSVGSGGQVNGKRRSSGSPREAQERLSSILDPQASVPGKDGRSKTDSTQDDITAQGGQPIGFMVERKVDFHGRRRAGPALDFHSAIFSPVLQPQFGGIASRETKDHPGDFLLKLGSQDTPVGEVQDSMRQNRKPRGTFLGKFTEPLYGHGSHPGEKYSFRNNSGPEALQVSVRTTGSPLLSPA
jgi:hypothetical protein